MATLKWQLKAFCVSISDSIFPLQYTVLDGGFSDNIPCFDSNTITVCPFAGEADICPRDLTAVDMSVDLGHTSFHVSEDNIFRLNHALNPMEPDMLLSLCEEGYNECLRFLHRKGESSGCSYCTLKESMRLCFNEIRGTENTGYIYKKYPKIRRLFVLYVNRRYETMFQ